MRENARGAGVAFGADVTTAFLKRTNLKFVIRSHECVERGFDYPYASSSIGQNCLCTVFSASNYGGHSNNNGSYMVLQLTKTNNASNRAPASGVYTIDQVIDQHLDVELPDCNISYSVRSFEITAEMAAMMQKAFTATSSNIHDLITRKRGALLIAFERLDGTPNNNSLKGGTSSSSSSSSSAFPQKADVDTPAPITSPPSGRALTNYVTNEQWVIVMKDVTDTKLHWDTMVGFFVPRSCRDIDGGRIQYRDFLDSFTLGAKRAASAGTQRARGSIKRLSKQGNKAIFGDDNNPGIKSTGYVNSDALNSIDDNYDDIEALYSQHKQMEIIFDYFDADDSGAIGPKQFIAGCETLNKSLPVHLRIADPARIFSIMDIDNSGKLNPNEFFEIFRIAEIRAKEAAAAAGRNAASGDFNGDDEGRMDALLALSLEHVVLDNDYDEESDDDTVVPDHRPDVGRFAVGSRRNSIDIHGVCITVD